MNAPDRIVRWPEVRELVGLARSTVDKLERLGRFPKRHPLTDYAVGWRLSEILEFVSGRRDWSTASSSSELEGALPDAERARMIAFRGRAGSRS